MYTRSGVQGSGFGAPAASRPARDPPAWGRELGPPQGPRRGLQEAPESPSRESREHAGQRFMGAYTLIVPSEKRRNEMQRMAAKELEDLERWKEQQRTKPINLAPKQLGGNHSEVEVRQRQQLQLIQSKYQKKLKREEYIRIKREAEEAEIQKMKAIQREKSDKLEEKKRLQENLRREAFREHQQCKTAEFLRRLDTQSPHRGTCPVAVCDPQSSAWAGRQAYMDSIREGTKKLQKMKDEHCQKSELLELKHEQQEEERAKIHQAEHRRVNNAFLDRLQGESQPGGLQHFGGYWNMNSGNSWDI
ncbi:epithelial-stromal interaction protein 1 isoform X2 [Physeter macrocephalus]|uniref:Epithelial-stromal interaction protein 1 isoform X2 n=2 Tax=Physeter macrocephalus TaxID=9755 RepID=A0A2Y9SSW9_PHYMC|nr:epithelial-stromal interaction protein 1 isoform X2 [Physeter catodon]|eukprot:XP_023981751.1 epithelial-stromal interaction protein 1 isoform X2 [Physeter catodon]